MWKTSFALVAYEHGLLAPSWVWAACVVVGLLGSTTTCHPPSFAHGDSSQFSCLLDAILLEDEN